MFVMFLLVLWVNLFREKPALETLLFALALAVGLTPELLPAIISITLAHGAQSMAKRGVIVRKLNAIENFGSMDILCTDKTGTLTEGTVILKDACDFQGNVSSAVLRFAYLNAFHQTGLGNPLDEAIQLAGQKSGTDISRVQKVDEIPYDFNRKRLSVVVADEFGHRLMITKGALANVLNACNSVAAAGSVAPLDDNRLSQINNLFREWSHQGFRVLGIATKTVSSQDVAYSREDETALSFAGFLLFFDPPKADVAQTISDLSQRGVQLKMITGDNQLVARHVAEAVNLPIVGVLTGTDLNSMGTKHSGTRPSTPQSLPRSTPTRKNASFWH